MGKYGGCVPVSLQPFGSAAVLWGDNDRAWTGRTPFTVSPHTLIPARIAARTYENSLQVRSLSAPRKGNPLASGSAGGLVDCWGLGKKAVQPGFTHVGADYLHVLQI